MFRHRFIRNLLILAFACVAGVSVAAAQDTARLRITAVDASRFPDIAVTLLAQSASGSPVADFTSLTLTEDGNPVEGVTFEAVQSGVDLVFVINANDTIDERDGTNSSRADKVREAINLFADQYMDEAQRDRVSIVVPPFDDAPNGLLLEDAIFVNEVKNEINFYEASTNADVPLNEMMIVALDHLAALQPEGRFQQIVLFTDGAGEAQLFDYDALNSRLAEQGVTFSAAILGQRADDTEIGNVARLYEPSLGTYVHMPAAADILPLYAAFEGFRQQQRGVYRSRLTASGDYAIEAALEGATASATVSVVVEPPEVAILLDDSQPIKRVASSADMPLEEMQPTAQTVVAQVVWSAGQRRTISVAELAVNGEVVAEVPGSAIDDDGVFAVDWDITNLDQGEYELVVTITDELGVVTNSPPLVLTIEVDRPVVVTVPADGGEAAPAATAVPANPMDDPIEVVSENAGLIGIVVGVLLVFVAVLMLVFAFIFMRRRSGRNALPAATPVVAAAPVSQTAAAGGFDVDSTQIMAPAFVQRTADAYLEALENAPEHTGHVPLSGNNVAMGRDPKLAQVIFKDKSVSRLHARIMQSGGEYRLYDEGSASGTYHNYERVGLTPQTLKDNDDIHLGRVHLRFKITTPAGDSDATQVFGPAGPSAPPPPAGGADDMSTQAYMPHSPAAPPAASAADDDDDPDGLSTQPFIPHQ